MMGLLSRVSSWSNGGPSVGLVEGFHCGINLRRQPAAQAGPHAEPLRLRLSLAGITSTGRSHADGDGQHEPLLLLTGKSFDFVHPPEPHISAGHAV